MVMDVIFLIFTGEFLAVRDEREKLEEIIS